MHDRRLLSDSELDVTDLARGQAQLRMTLPAVPPAKRTANFWALMGFCAVGLVCSLYVPAAYLQAVAMLG